MSSKLPPLKKRKINSLERPVSPPLRRKPKSEADPATTSAVPSTPTSKPNGDIKERLEIISWNVNGVSHLLPAQNKKITSFFNARKRSVSTPSDSDSEASSPLRQFLKSHNFPQLLCLQEVKIAPSDETTQKSLRRAANDGEGPKYELHFSLPRDKHNARGLGGRGKVHGVCTLVRSDLLCTTKDVDWDLEGRVLVTRFEQWKIVVVNGYWPNGTTNLYRSPSTGAVTGTRHEFKRAFHAHMLAEVKTLEGEGWNVVLMGDMNIAPSALDGHPGVRLGDEHVRNRRVFNWNFLDEGNREGMRGVDSWRWVHGGKRGYSYHGERKEEWGSTCDRVDLGVVSRSLVGMGVLRGADIWESVEERGGSDHVPIGVVLDVGSLTKEIDVGDTGEV